MTYLELIRSLEPEVLALMMTCGCPNSSLTRLAPVPCLEKLWNPDGKKESFCQKCLLGLFNQEVPSQVMLDVCAMSKHQNDKKPPDQRPAIGESLIAGFLSNLISDGLLNGGAQMPMLEGMISDASA